MRQKTYRHTNRNTHPHPHAHTHTTYVCADVCNIENPSHQGYRVSTLSKDVTNIGLVNTFGNTKGVRKHQLFKLTLMPDGLKSSCRFPERDRESLSCRIHRLYG